MCLDFSLDVLFAGNSSLIVAWLPFAYFLHRSFFLYQLNLTVFWLLSQRKWWMGFLPLLQKHTHTVRCVCAERERERVRERRGNQRPERKKVSQPAASEENGDHAGWMPPLVDAANALNFFSLTVGFPFHSVALYTSMRYGCFCAVFVLRRPFVCVELA